MNQLVEIAYELENLCYETREEAERAAERFEKFVIEMELGCIPKTSIIVGTIATLARGIGLLGCRFF